MRLKFLSFYSPHFGRAELCWRPKNAKSNPFKNTTSTLFSPPFTFIPFCCFVHFALFPHFPFSSLVLFGHFFTGRINKDLCRVHPLLRDYQANLFHIPIPNFIFNQFPINNHLFYIHPIIQSIFPLFDCAINKEMLLLSQ